MTRHGPPALGYYARVQIPHKQRKLAYRSPSLLCSGGSSRPSITLCNYRLKLGGLAALRSAIHGTCCGGVEPTALARVCIGHVQQHARREVPPKRLGHTALGVVCCAIIYAHVEKKCGIASRRHREHRHLVRPVATPVCTVKLQP